MIATLIILLVAAAYKTISTLLTDTLVGGLGPGNPIALMGIVYAATLPVLYHPVQHAVDCLKARQGPLKMLFEAR